MCLSRIVYLVKFHGQGPSSPLRIIFYLLLIDTNSSKTYPLLIFCQGNYILCFSVGIPFPAPLKSIARVEQQNSLSINVFGYEEVIYPLYLSSRDGDPINLLLISKVVDGESRSHYVWVKNINALLYDQNKKTANKFFCVRCLCSFNTEASLAKHTPECKRIADGEPARVVMPDDPTLTFGNHAKMMKAPYIIYADTEALVTPVENDGGTTTRDARHVPCSVGFVVVRSDGKKTREFFYRGADCIAKFYRELEDVSFQLLMVFFMPSFVYIVLFHASQPIQIF